MITTETKALTVSELTERIKGTLERTFPRVNLQGEISNFKLQSSGHLYFSLKDQNAQISCCMFRGNAGRLKTLPKEGDQVEVIGEINVYPPRGNYQLIIRELKPIGVGELLLKYHQLKEKLETMGWFDPRQKKKLPPLPKTIGVVTSPTGAVIQDIIHVLERRVGNFHLILNPVKVQGEGAKEEIAQAIYDFNRYNLADVLIVGRGGGSFEDLFPFSEEIVARAIHESHIPIISAVGHETDTSIADFVADIRAPTPSAAAEIVMKEKNHLIEQLVGAKQFIDRNIHTKIDHYKELLRRITKQPVLQDPYTLLGLRLQRLDELKSAIDQRIHFKIQTTKTELKGIINTLKAIDPKNLLKRGFSILFSENKGNVITSKNQLEVGSHIVAKLSDGEANLEVLK